MAGKIVVPEEGAFALVKKLLDGFAIPDIISVRLFKNDLIPRAATVLADFVEADFDGYATIHIDPGAEGIIEDDPPGARLRLEDIAFHAGSGITPQSIFGYYVVIDSQGKVAWAARDLSAPVLIDTPGQTYAFGLRLHAESLFFPPP